VVKVLLAADAKPDLADGLDWTPLVGAAYRGHVKVAKLLMKAGAKPGLQDPGGWTPLKTAASKGHVEFVKLLLKKAGVKPYPQDGGADTPLWRAASRGHAEVAKLLLEAGADLDGTGPDGRTALMIFAHAGDQEMVKALLTEGADVMPRDNVMKSAEQLAHLESHPKVEKLIDEYTPHGWALLKYHLTRGQTWLCIAAGIVGAIAIFTMTEALALAKGKAKAYAVAAQPGEDAPAVSVLIPRGAKLLAAMRIRGSFLAKLQREVEVLSNLVAVFGVLMLYVSPRVMIPAFAVLFGIPALCAYELWTLLRRPALILVAANQWVALLRSLFLAAALLVVFRATISSALYDCGDDFTHWRSEWSHAQMDFCCKHAHLGCRNKLSMMDRIQPLASAERWVTRDLTPGWAVTVPGWALNPRALAIVDPDLWEPNMWLCVQALLCSQAAALALYVLSLICALLRDSCRCRQGYQGYLPAAKGEEAEIEQLARDIVSAGDSGRSFQDLGVNRLPRWGLTGVDFLLLVALVDCVFLDTYTVFSLLRSDNYMFAAILTAVASASLWRVLLRTGLGNIWEQRNESLRLGYLTEPTYELIDDERSFEAFFSLALTSYSLLFSIATPLDVVFQGLSLLTSAWGLAGFIYERADLGVA